MNVWLQLQALGRRLCSRVTGDDAPSATESLAANSDETRQLDLLLQEIRVNEAQLGSHHWAKLAASFQDRLSDRSVPAKQPSAERRPSRYTNAASHALPLGALLTAIFVLTSPGDPEGSIANGQKLVADATAQLPSPEVRVPTLPVVRADAPTTTTSHVLNTPPAPPVVKHANRPMPHRAQRQPPAQVRSIPQATTPVHPPPAREPVSVSAVARASSEPSGPEDTFAEQLAALKLADRALKSDNPTAARDALAREFSPQLGLHARALRVILACQDGSVQLGKRALAEQASRYPNSPYLARMRRACGVGAEH